MSDSPRQFIAKRQLSHRHFDPFGAMKFLSNGAVVLMAPIALSIMVPLRYKLGYRTARPILLATVIYSLMFWAVVINVLSYGWFHVKRDTPIGTYFAQAQVQDAEAAEPEPPAGYDAPLPLDWQLETPAEQQAWSDKHRVTDPRRLQELQQKRVKDAQRRQEKAQKAQAAAARQAAYERSYHFPLDWHWSLFLYACVFLYLGIQRRKEGARLIRQGWHTMSRGESYLSRYFPNVREYRMQAFLEPGLVFLLGMVLVIGGWYFRLFSTSLGLWMMWAAICLSFSEILLMELALDDALDKQDAEVEGRQYIDIRKAIRSSMENQRVSETGGIRGATFDAETAEFLRKRAEEAAMEEEESADLKPVS
jgi:hypothetical protein